MSLLVNSHIPAFCSFYVGLVYDETNGLFLFYPSSWKERVEKEREGKYNDTERKSHLKILIQLSSIFNNVLKLSFDDEPCCIPLYHQMLLLIFFNIFGVTKRSQIYKSVVGCYVFFCGLVLKNTMTNGV